MNTRTLAEVIGRVRRFPDDECCRQVVRDLGGEHRCLFRESRDGFCELHHPTNRLKAVARQLRRAIKDVERLERLRDELAEAVEKIGGKR